MTKIEVIEYTSETIKAFVIWWDDEWCALVMAMNRNQAKAMALREFSNGDVEYTHARARRASDFDDVAAEGGPRVIYSNAGLPADRPFYSDEV